MTNELFESLLFEEEGATLDFKKEQYRFARASDDEKAELLKDIIGFANSWRRETAYILIGVEEIRGGKSNVLGIAATDQLDDHSLQQCINNLLNTPVRFQYRAFRYEDKQVGIFVLDKGQQRPIHLTRNYGKLEKDKVYIRRGSSTDPQKPASPTEIARMGVGKPREKAALLVEFAEVDRDDAIGACSRMKFEFCTLPDAKDIPTSRQPQNNDYGLGMDHLQRHNEDYYLELANYEFMKRLARRVRVTVKNVGEVAASNVRLELTIPIGIGLLPALTLPRKPARVESFDRHLSALRPINRRDPGEVDIDENKDRFRIEIDCKDLQPGRRVWSDKFYIGAGKSGDYPIQGEVYADNLPVPQQFTLTIEAEVEHTTLSVKELRAI